MLADRVAPFLAYSPMNSLVQCRWSFLTWPFPDREHDGRPFVLKRRRTIWLAAFGGLATLALAACGGGSGGGTGTSSSATFNAATTKVVNPSTHKGGTLSFGLSSTPDSTDPGNTYYAFMWNLSRLYTMPLMTYKSCPGKCGLQVVPDLATRRSCLRSTPSPCSTAARS
jgi:hypothetical protein